MANRQDVIERGLRSETDGFGFHCRSGKEAGSHGEEPQAGETQEEEEERDPGPFTVGGARGFASDDERPDVVTSRSNTPTLYSLWLITKAVREVSKKEEGA